MPPQATGIPLLDAQLAGGLPEGALLWYRYAPRADAEPLVLHAMRTRLEAGGTAVALNLAPSPSAILAGLKEQGLAPAAAARLRVVQAKDVAGRGTPTWAGLAQALESAARGLPDPLLALPRVELIAETLDLNATGAGFQAVLRVAPESRVHWAGATEPPPTSRAVATVALGMRLEGLKSFPFFEVQSCPWSPPPAPARHTYTVLRPGGVVPHIPKILVTGPHDAGKSEFIRTICPQAASVETAGSTVALDHGQVQRGGVLVDLFGTPGQERFEPVIRQLAQGALGLILVWDASRPETLRRAKQILAHTWRPGVPLVVAANKPEAPNAPTAADVRARLGLDPHVPVLPCQANRAEPALRVLDALVERILHPASNL